MTRKQNTKNCDDRLPIKVRPKRVLFNDHGKEAPDLIFGGGAKLIHVPVYQTTRLSGSSKHTRNSPQERAFNRHLFYS